MSQQPKLDPDGGQLLALYERMLLIRRVEERLGADAAAGKLPGAVHLSIGQEAMAAGVCMQLSDSDRISSTHRAHGHYLAKGGDLRAMAAEILGKRTGICRGLGGSMHIADMSKGILGANGIVGGGLAIAAGAAFAAKLEGNSNVVVAFFGDGAANQGVLMECLNISTLWRLPIIFVCEHNQYSEFTPASDVTSGEIADRARAFKIPTCVIDGNDVIEVWKAAATAIARAREGAGPSFIEGRTYRIRGHLEGEEAILGQGRYRNQEEIDEWSRRDPLDRLAKWLASESICDQSELTNLAMRTQALVDDAMQFAEMSEQADPELSLGLMFDDQPAR
jgi:acetoin:2,6-dichlorophenolindophenol oxidoreductase subunit alpha